MSAKDPQERPAKRGEAAWKEFRDGVAARNAQAQRAGMQRREEDERRRAAVRNAAEQRRLTGLIRKRRSP
jgi:uncharacterized protein involved in type VI secretion and phage assembly